MVQRNINVAKLSPGYLFPKIGKRKQAFLQRNPEAEIISLGIGDTTEPLPDIIVNRLVQTCIGLGTHEGYVGYGTALGLDQLRQQIATTLYSDLVGHHEVFINDGSKCDIGRLQTFFGPETTIAVQDPSYPVYIDSSVLIGQTGNFQEKTGQYDKIRYLSCHPENNFFPDLNKEEKTDLIYYCSPNNPTGTVATREQLQSLVDFARSNHSIIIFDAAYARYIQNPNVPKSIYELEGAREVAIEVNSFSKFAGFTGIRAGWTIVPDTLRFEDGSSVLDDWLRTISLLFNGPSHISQQGALAALEPEGISALNERISYYMENAKILRQAFIDVGLQCYGGIEAPFLWVYFGDRNSWDIFDDILETMHIITTPGVGFGPTGNGFIRISAFGHRYEIEEAAKRLRQNLHLCASINSSKK